mmetsp:Transcript_8495/g.9874  ORF Transcript_8495/g.9874 Transcript_8495/m.9874 type:complete len:227 (+) Transcript_8495:128-808(+)
MPPHEQCSKSHMSAYIVTTRLDLTERVGANLKTSSLLCEEVQCYVDGESCIDQVVSKPQHDGVLEMEIVHHQSVPKKSILKTSNSGIKSIRKNAKVQFSNAHIRTFPQVLGDHPCCSSGLPLSLGWNHCSEQIISVDEMEDNRVPSRRKELRMDEIRRRMILQESESSSSPSTSSQSLTRSETSFSLYSKEELRRAERRLSRERQRLRKRSLVNQFFSPVSASESE